MITSYSTFTEEVDIANRFNDFFSCIGAEVSSKIYENGDVTGHYIRNIRDHVHINCFHFQTVTSVEVQTIRNNLLITGSEQDGLPMFVFDENSLVDMIVYISTKNLLTGVFPLKLAETVAVCIFIAGKIDDLADYS